MRDAAAWERFERELANALEAMEPETFLIVEARAGSPAAGRYVQFAHGRNIFRAEASSNAYLRGERALTAAQEESLAGIGWSRPAADDADRNFYRTWPSPTPFGEIAAFASRTLTGAFEVDDPGSLEYRYASFEGRAVEALPLSIAAEGGPGRAPRPRQSAHGHELEAFRAMVEAALQRLVSNDQLVTDADGDWPIRLGSAMTFVRVVDGLPPSLQVFSILLRDVPVNAELLAELNLINARLRYVRVFAGQRAVIASLELPAVGLTHDAVAFACMELGNVADHLDDQLHGRFGGTIAFEPSPKLLN